MPVGTATAVAAIITAIIGTGTTIATSAMNNKAVEDANEESFKLAEQKRLDELEWRKENDKLNKFNKEMTKQQLALQKKKFYFGQQEAEEERAERSEERGYNRAQQNATRIANQVNQNAALRNNFINIWSR